MTAQMVDPLQDGDPVLLSRVRAGDPDAYAQLFERHRGAATAFAGSLAGPSHADDLVAEAFAKVLDALQRDLGPTVSFRSYLLTSIRSIWSNTVRTERRYDLVDDYETLPPTEALTLSDDPDQRFDSQAVAEAYRSLPERWQAVLWLTAVEGLPHHEVALHLGIKANAVAALSFRAREGLRQAYLSAHLGSAAAPACQVWAPLLPAYARDALDRRKRPGLVAHLDGCLECSLALADLDEVNNRLGALLVPIVLGPGVLGLPGLWAATGAGTTAAASHGGGLLSAAKTSIAATVAAGVVGGAVALPMVLTGADERPDGVAATSAHAVDPAPADVSRAHGATLAARPVAPRPAAGTPGTSTAPAGEVPPAAPVDARTPDPVAPDPVAPDPVAPPAGTIGEGLTDSAPPAVVPTGPAAPTAPTTPNPTAPTTPTTPTAPTTPTGLSPDVALAAPVVGPVSYLGQAFTRLTVPLTNVRTGTQVTVVVTDVVGYPVKVASDGWRCPGLIGGLIGSLFQPTTTVTCTWTGADTAATELSLAMLATDGSQASVSVAQVAGVVDPDPANNTATVPISR